MRKYIDSIDSVASKKSSPFYFIRNHSLGYKIKTVLLRFQLLPLRAYFDSYWYFVRYFKRSL